MNEPGIYYPGQLSAHELDFFLAKGWYRMGQGIFTTHYIMQQDLFYRVFWLRYHLTGWQPGRSSQKIRKAGQSFTVTEKNMELTDELEELYALYKTAVNFEPAASVRQWLLDDREHSIYNTRLVEIRDKGKLIAAGIYDTGLNSIAGIMNFFHPDYKKYSLGKYLMLLKMEVALRAGLEWYYPGYIVLGFPKFDYKLFAGKKAAEIFIPELNQWYRYNPLLMDIIHKASRPEASGN